MLFKFLDLLNRQVVADGLLCQHPQGGIGHSRYSCGPRRLSPFVPIAGIIPRVTGLLRAMFSVIIP